MTSMGICTNAQLIVVIGMTAGSGVRQTERFTQGKQRTRGTSRSSLVPLVLCVRLPFNPSRNARPFGRAGRSCGRAGSAGLLVVHAAVLAAGGHQAERGVHH